MATGVGSNPDEMSKRLDKQTTQLKRIRMSEQKKYSIQIDFIYWDTVSYQNNDTLLSSIIFHKPSGRMSVNTYNSKSKNKKMAYYQCTLIK